MRRDWFHVHLSDLFPVTILLLFAWPPIVEHAEALTIKPRFTGPAGYFLQRQAWNRTVRDEDVLPSSWNGMWDFGQPDVGQPDVRSNEGTEKLEWIASNCSNTGSSYGCDQPPARHIPNPSVPSDPQSVRHQALIESFQRRLLQQLGLTEVPRVSEDSWSAVPRVIQQRMKAKVVSSNKVTEAPSTDNEEKEAIFLLEPYPTRITSAVTFAFILRIADDMEHRQIISGHIHAENLNGIPSDLELELWEMSTSWSDYSPELEDIPYGESPQFGRDTLSSELDLATGGPVSVQLVQPMIAAVTTVRNGQTVSFDVTSRLKQWVKFRAHSRRKNARIAPIVKQVLLICPGCVNDRIPIDPKKVVLHVRYSSLPQRHRRSVELNDAAAGGGGLINSCHPDGHQFTCCTQSLQIRFADIGWDKWIVFPDQVEPNFCRGTCQNAGTRSMHYEMLELLQRQNASRLNGARTENIRSCCYPTRRTSFSILYMDAEKEVRMHVLHNFIVLGCGCS